MRLVDITDWRRDELFSPYPEGSRDKYAVIAPDACGDGRVVCGHRYLMKFSNRRYPVQFWSELMATFVGAALRVMTPPTYIALDPQTGEPGSLIEWFYGPIVEKDQTRPAPSLTGLGQALRSVFGLEQQEVPKTHSLYVPGSNYLTRTVPSYDLKTGRQHNLMDVGVWITSLGRLSGQTFWPHWTRLLTFDALIGNTDRHQDNWGVLWRMNAKGDFVPRFAPAFDNGTSLAHELMEERLKTFATDEAVDRYVRRGRHHMRWQRKDEKPGGHFELLQRLADFRPRLVGTIVETVHANLEPALGEITALSELPISVPLSDERVDVICRMIRRRAAILRDMFPR